MAQIRRIQSEEARRVYFSKRRAGLFKKAGELAILCGVELAIVTFSPSGKAFAYGHPSVEAILERYAPTGAGAGGGGGASAGEDYRRLAEVNRQYGEVMALLEEEKARAERTEAAMAKQRAAGSPVAAWLEADVRELGEEELMAYAAAIAEVQAAVAARTNRLLQDALNRRAMAVRARSSNNYVVPAPQPQQFFINAGAGFVDQFGAGSSSANHNGANMDMQIQQQMMHMEMKMMLQQGFGFPGPY